MAYHKVLGTDNPADLMTKYLIKEIVEKHSSKLSVEFPGGHAETAPALHNLHCTKALWQLEEEQGYEEDDADAMLTAVQTAVNEAWWKKWKQTTRAQVKKTETKTSGEITNSTTTTTTPTTTTTNTTTTTTKRVTLKDKKKSEDRSKHKETRTMPPI